MVSLLLVRSVLRALTAKLFDRVHNCSWCVVIDDETCLSPLDHFQICDLLVVILVPKGRCIFECWSNEP